MADGRNGHPPHYVKYPNQLAMINWDKFNEHLQYYDQQLILEVIGIFIREYPNNITTLGKNVQEKDYHNVDLHAHSLKSNCALFGAVEAAELCLKLELMGKKKADEDMDGVFRMFVTASELLVAELEEYRQKLSA